MQKIKMLVVPMVIGTLGTAQKIFAKELEESIFSVSFWRDSVKVEECLA